MAQYDGEIRIKTKIDDSGAKTGVKSLASQAAVLAAQYRKAGMSQSDAFKKAWAEIERTSAKGNKKISQDVNQMTQATTQAFKNLGFAVAGVFSAKMVYDYAKAAVNAAIQIESSMMRVNDIFGQSSQKVVDFAEKSAYSLGMSRKVAYEYAATYGNLFSSIAQSSEENSTLTIKALQASAVISSKTGRTMEDVMSRIRSGYLGNTEAIEDLNINVNVAMLEMTEAFQSIANGRSWEKLTFYEQQQIRLLAILEQAHKKYGDEVARSSALSQSRLIAAMENLKVSIGSVLNVAIIPMLDALATFATLLNSIFVAIFGKGAAAQAQLAKSSESAANSQNKLAANTSKAAKAAKGGVAAFDELNVLQKATADIEGGETKPTATGITVPEMTGEVGAGIKLSPGFQMVVDTLKKLGEWTGSTLAPAFMDALRAAGNLLSTALETLKPLFIWAWENIFLKLAAWTGGTVVQILKDLTKALNGISNWIKDNQDAVRTATVVILGFMAAWKVTELMAFIQISGGVTAALSGITLALWGGVTAKIADKAETIALTALYAKDFIVAVAGATTKMLTNIVTFGILTAAKIADTIATIATTVATIAYNVAVGIATVATTAFNVALAILTSPITLVIAAIALLVVGIIALIKNWDKVKETAKSVWEGVVKAWEKAGEWFKTNVTEPIAKKFEDVKKDINKFVTAAWDGTKEAWNKAAEWFEKNVTDPIKAVFKGLWNGIIDGLNFVIRQLNKIQIDIPDWVPAFGGNSIGFDIPEIPKLAKGAVIAPNQPFLAQLGDQPSGINIETPLQTMIDAFKTALSEMGQSGGGEAVLVIDGQEIGRAILPHIDKEQKRIGASLITRG